MRCAKSTGRGPAGRDGRARHCAFHVVSDTLGAVLACGWPARRRCEPSGSAGAAAGLGVLVRQLPRPRRVLRCTTPRGLCTVPHPRRPARRPVRRALPAPVVARMLQHGGDRVLHAALVLDTPPRHPQTDRHHQQGLQRMARGVPSRRVHRHPARPRLSSPRSGPVIRSRSAAAPRAKGQLEPVPLRHSLRHFREKCRPAFVEHHIVLSPQLTSGRAGSWRG